MTKEPKPVKERDNLNLLELVCQLHSRALNFPSKEMHDAYMEARKELEKRLQGNVNEDEIIQSTIEFCNANNIPAIPMLTEILRNTIRETKKQLSSPSPVQGMDEKDLIIYGLEEGAEAWKSEYDNCRAILIELVALKRIKDMYGKDDDYERRQPLAWERAKEFLKKYQHE